MCTVYDSCDLYQSADNGAQYGTCNKATIYWTATIAGMMLAGWRTCLHLV